MAVQGVHEVPVGESRLAVEGDLPAWSGRGELPPVVDHFVARPPEATGAHHLLVLLRVELVPTRQR